MGDPVIWTVFIISTASHVTSNFLHLIQKNTWLNPALGGLVERVLVLHGSGPASPIGIVVVLGRTTRGLQQALRAVAPAH